MFEILIHLAIGTIIGWHIPQPVWASEFFDKVKLVVSQWGSK